MQLSNPTPPILVHLTPPSPAQPHPALSLPHSLPAAPALCHTWRGSDAFALTPFIAMAIGLAMIGLRAMGRALYSWVGRAVRAGPIIFQGEFSKLVAGLTSTTRSIAPGSCDEEGGEKGSELHAWPVAGLTSTTRSIAPGNCNEEGGEKGRSS